MELGVEKHCFCSSKALQLMVKSSAFAEAIPLLFVMRLNQIDRPSGLDWRKVAVGQGNFRGSVHTEACAPLVELVV